MEGDQGQSHCDRPAEETGSVRYSSLSKQVHPAGKLTLHCRLLASADEGSEGDLGAGHSSTVQLHYTTADVELLD